MIVVAGGIVTLRVAEPVARRCQPAYVKEAGEPMLTAGLQRCRSTVWLGLTPGRDETPAPLLGADLSVRPGWLLSALRLRVLEHAVVIPVFSGHMRGTRDLRPGHRGAGPTHRRLPGDGA